METQGVTLDEIYDVIAFRIVIEGGRDACYAALGIVHATWPPVPGRFKDYVALPKPNGYQSLHTTVIGPYGERMEVQIRTQEMHRNAEFGIAAHWKYKDEGGRSARDDAKFDWLRQLMERQQELDDPHEFLDVVKVDLFPDAVFVFTPKGDVINLPKGATPIDFAYAIHSQVGEHCSGARVNGKMVPLRHQPARRRHRRDPDQPVAAAEQGLARLRGLGQGAQQDPPRDPRSPRTRAPASSAARCSSARCARAGLSLAARPRARRARRGGAGARARRARRPARGDRLRHACRAATVVRALRPDWKPEPEPEAPRERPARGPKQLLELFRRQPKASSTGIRVEGQGDVLVRFANCCTPLPGDEVVGFVTRGPRRHRPPEGLPRRLPPRPAAPRRGRVGRRRPGRAAHPHEVTSRDEPGPAREDHEDHLRRRASTSARRASPPTPTAPPPRASTSGSRTCARSPSVMKEIERIKGVLSVERLRG